MQVMSEPRTTRPIRVASRQFTPCDPAQVVYRRMLSELDDDQLVEVETDIVYFLNSGEFTGRLVALMDGARAFAA